MTEPSRFAIVYWLLPAPPARDFFRATIRRLAREFDAPVFEPHLTLAVGPASLEAAKRALAQLTGDAVELRPLCIAFSSKFTKTLFVRFESTPRLFELRSSLGNEEDSTFDPHLSLLYKKLPAEEQARLAARIQLPFATVRFDAIAATYCRLPVATAADVAVWNLVEARCFAQ